MSRRKKHYEPDDFPTVAQLQQERIYERYKIRYHRAVRSTVVSLITVAAVAVILSYMLFPVLRIYGHSMTPTLSDGQIVAAMKGSHFSTGDIVAFYYNNKILIKRVIAGPGDWVDIDRDGNVSVNEQQIEEPYLEDKALGEANIDFPVQVPENRWFVMGDHRSVSIDSRNTAVGMVSDEQIVGRVLFRFWPLREIGVV